MRASARNTLAAGLRDDKIPFGEIVMYARGVAVERNANTHAQADE